MRQTALFVALLTLMDVGCSSKSPQSVKGGVQTTNGGAAPQDDWISKLEPEFKAISEDKAHVARLIESGRARDQEKKLSFEDAMLLAKLAAASKQADISAEFYELAMSLHRNGTTGPKILVQIEMADMLLKLRKYKLAIDVYKEILASWQLNQMGRSLIYSSLAQALANDGRHDEALNAIRKAIGLADEKSRPIFVEALKAIGKEFSLASEQARLRFFEAWIYSHASRWDEAIQKLEQVMRDYPDEKEILLQCQFNLSNIYVQKGEWRKGEEILEKVLEVNPDNAQVNNDLGYLWADQGKNLEQAEIMIRKALAADPDNAAYLDSLGWVLFNLGKHDEAIPPLQEAIRRSIGSDSASWDHLGDVFMDAMELDKAVEAWQTALDHWEEELTSDPRRIERIKEKLKQNAHNANADPIE